MASFDRFGGKVALVTGAASGIGAATAARLASEGAAVACLDVAIEGAEKTAAEIVAAGGAAKAYAVNVASEDSVKQGVAQVLADHDGQLDAVLNIAGIGRFHHTHEAPLEDWDKIIGVNLTGTFLVCRETLPTLLETKGNIVNTASNAGLHGAPYSAAYCASKGGVVQLTRALAYEYVRRGVRVNAVAPGGVETPIQNSFGFPDNADGKLFHKIMGFVGNSQPSDLASLFAYVASDEAKYMTGAIVTMDGGLTC